jgi:hypothetical protein
VSQKYSFYKFCSSRAAEFYNVAIKSSKYLLCESNIEIEDETKYILYTFSEFNLTTASSLSAANIVLHHIFENSDVMSKALLYHLHCQ